VSKERNIAKPYSWVLDQQGILAEHRVRDHLWMLPGVQCVVHRPLGICDVDLAMMQFGKVIYVEVERRMEWRAGLFPFDTVHVPARKAAMIFKRAPLLYYSVRNDLQLAAVLSGSDIISSAPYTDHNILMVDTLDTFFDVPKDKILCYEKL
jgi:hypothetical protein